MFHAMIKTIRRTISIFFIFLFLSSFYLIQAGHVKLGLDWRTADRRSAGIAPNPEKVREALVQVYSARAFSWRGIFGVHTWIALKPKEANHYVVLQVIGWRKWRGLPVVKVEQNLPDRLWFEATPTIIGQICGKEAEIAIPKIIAAVNTYPHPHEYHIWPGPNSNTFTAHLIRQVPELEVDLPATAIGKDYLPGNAMVAEPVGEWGIQITYKGLVGFELGPGWSMDVNLLGVSFGATFNPLGLQLPLLGRVGVKPQLCQPSGMDEMMARLAH